MKMRRRKHAWLWYMTFSCWESGKRTYSEIARIRCWRNFTKTFEGK